MYTEVQAVREETKGYEEAIAKATELNTTLATLISKKNSFSLLETERLEALVPDEIDGVRALVDLEQLATRNGLLFDRVSINLEGEGQEGGAETEATDSEAITELENGLLALDVTFSVIGNYTQFKSFLQDIEKSLVLMDVSELAFQTSTGELTNYNVTVRLYGMGVSDEE